MATVLLLFIGLLLAKLAGELALDALNLANIRRNADRIPDAYVGRVDEATYARSVSYSRAKLRLGMLETIYEALVLGALVLSALLPGYAGALPWLYEMFSAWAPAIWGGALGLFLTAIVLGLPSLPFELYRQFRLEERYGFNTMTFKLWLTDKAKGLVVGAVLAIPLLALLLYLVANVAQWWLWGFGVFFAFQLLMLVLFPMLILPLFNKLTPLPEGDLRTRLLALAARTGFTARTILEMDGSKRSRHSNAFFTGFGKFRRIVLFDTLIEQLEPRELEGVLAHEIGHYKLGHIPQRLVLAAVTGLGGFWVIGWLVEAGWFVAGFGFPAEVGAAPAFLLFSLLAGLLTFWLSPVSNAWSRRHEYQADAFAKASLGGDPQPLIAALRKLHEKNLSNLTPHPVYSAFHYSHPNLPEREAALAAG